jgi:hypothetical protein
MRWFPIARFFVLLTLNIGAYMHLNNLVFGTDLLLQHLFTPLFDSLFAIPMIIGGFAVIFARKEFIFRNKLEKGIVYWTAFYFIGSLPLHTQTWLTQSTEYIRWFPVWYSAVFLAYTAFMQWIWWRLEVPYEMKPAAA